MNLNDVLKMYPGLNGDELNELVLLAKAADMVGQITFVDDPGSDAGRAALEYVKSHHWLPRNYRTLPVEEVKACGRTLDDPKAKLLQKKRALMLLAHRGSIEAYRILKSYVPQALPELKVWAQMAFDECKTFLAADLSDEVGFGANIISSSVGRNEPCPCGSNKKYKYCCGKA